MSDSNPLIREEIAAQAAALADHLHRSGVQFLPLADPTAVESLRGRLTPATDPTEARTQPTVPAPSVPASSVPASSVPASSVPASSVPAPSVPATAAARPTTLPGTSADSGAQAYPGMPLAAADRQQQLDAMAERVAACVRCDALASCRTRTVFGEGSPTPRVAFFGEGPGVEEDRTGRPFVGRAGQLLTKMIEACSFRREDVYILNTVKCRPPNNRNPEPDEVDHCREYFETQLSILRPEYIVCLGAVSSRALLRSTLSVGRLRGKLHRYFESKVLVTYHPAYLLRTPAAKKAAWEDLQLMLRDAGIDPNAKR